MNDTTKSLTAGLLIIASIVAAVGIILASATPDIMGQPQTYTVYFDVGSDVQGLDDKSRVRLLGADIGKVHSVQVLTPEGRPPRIRVDFVIPGNYPLRTGASIAIQSKITGGALLNIESLGDGPPLTTNDELVGHSTSIGQVMTRFSHALPALEAGIASIKKTSDQIGALTGDLHEQVPNVVKRYDRVMINAQEALANARDILGDSATDLRGMFTHLNHLTGAADTHLSTAFDDVAPTLTEVREFLTRAKTSLAKVDGVLDNGQVITEQARSILNDNRANIDQTLTNTRRASVELKGTVAEVRRAPWRLLKEPDAKDQRNLELFEAARQFAQGAQDLQAAAITLQLAAADPHTDPEKTEALHTQLNEEIESFIQVRQRLYDRFEP